MTRDLSQEERDYLAHLENNMGAYVARYEEHKRAQLDQGQRATLERERDRLLYYRDLVSAGTAQDTATGIKFKAAKLRVLQRLLASPAPTRTRTLATLSRTQLRTLARACTYLYNEQTGAVSDTFAFAERLLGTVPDDKGHVISSITIHLAFHGDNVSAFFNDHNARLASADVVRAELTLDARHRTVVRSTRPLSDAQRHQALLSLSRHLLRYS